MSDIDPTPETPTTLGDRLSWFRGDVAARITALMGPGAVTLTELKTIAQVITGLPGQGIPEVTSALALILAKIPEGPIPDPTAALGSIGSALAQIAQSLDRLEAAIGAGEYGSLELASVRGLLWGVLQAGAQFGVLPDGSGYTPSAGSSTLEGRRYVKWSTVAGLTVQPGGVFIDPETTWEGWQVYIQTDAPSAVLHDLTTPSASVDPFPVNSWVELGGSDIAGWSVDASYNVKGYLRAPVASYVLIAANTIGTNANGTWYGISWEGYDRAQYTVAGGLQPYELQNTGEFDGYSLYLKTYGGTVYFSTDRMATYNTGWPRVITGGADPTVYSNQPFEVYFCPPGVTPPGT